MNDGAQLVLVSNRGPASFSRDENTGQITATTGGGGVVTALTGLDHHRDALWISSAMGDEDSAVAREHDGKAFDLQLDDGHYRIRLVESDPEAYDGFYNIIANPMLWFIQHYLWDLSNAPDVRDHEVEAYESGYLAVNDDLANAVLEEIEGQEGAVVMLHDYHLYTAPRTIRNARPDVFITHFIHIPWSQPDSWRVLPRDVREDLYEGILANDIIGFHTQHYKRNFLLCCRELFNLDVDEQNSIVHFEDRDVWVRAYPLPISADTFARTARRPQVHAYQPDAPRRRREHLILRVDRADLSKN